MFRTLGETYPYTRSTTSKQHSQMTLTDKQKNRLRRLKLASDEGALGLVGELNDIEEKIGGVLLEKADKKDLENVLVQVGKMMEENEPEEPEVIEGPPGPKGDDYTLTEKDKEDIAKSIKVPVVERVVEKTEVIHETPIVTENVVEVAVRDTPQETRNKLASLEGEERLDKSAIKGIDELEKYLSERIAQIRGGISGVARGVQLYIDGIKRGLANTLNLKAGTGVTITHNHANGQNDITISAAAGYTDEQAQDAVGNAVGNGLDYDDTTGAISVDETELTIFSFDTEANIVASTPTINLVKISTDTKRIFVGNGTNWLVGSGYFATDLGVPDIGAIQSSNRSGYGQEYISDKRISNSSIGSNAETVDGGVRFNETGLEGEPSLQTYYGSAWNNIVAGFNFKEVDAVLEHTPIGYVLRIAVFSGNSDLLGLNGLPIVQGYKVSMGAYPVPAQINGGTF